MSHADPKEARKFPRAPKREPVRLKFQGDASHVPGYLVNLSEGGAFVRCAMPVEVGRQVQCAFIAEGTGGRHLIHCKGEVSWTATAEVRRQLGPGFGMRFIDPHAETVEILKQLTRTS